MYRESDETQLDFNDFYLPFGGNLNGQNRWVILSQKIPWKQMEKAYAIQFSDKGMGAPGKPFRMALGALIIKEKLQVSDEELVNQIIENPYLQYFIGMESYSAEAPFDSSLMVYFRKRLDGELLTKANEIIISEQKVMMNKKKRQIRKRLSKKRKRKSN